MLHNRRPSPPGAVPFPLLPLHIILYPALSGPAATAWGRDLARGSRWTAGAPLPPQSHGPRGGDWAGRESAEWPRHSRPDRQRHVMTGRRRRLAGPAHMADAATDAATPVIRPGTRLSETTDGGGGGRKEDRRGRRRGGRPGGRGRRWRTRKTRRGGCRMVTNITTLLLPPNRLRPSFFAIFFKRLDKNQRNFRSEHLRTCPNFHYLDILLSHKYFRHFPLPRNVNFQAADSLTE